MTVTIANSSTLIRPNVQGVITDLRGRPTDLLSWFERRGAVRPNDGGSPRKWLILPSSTNVGETYVEGQALGAVGQPTYGSASVASVYQRAAVQTTGHVRDQIARGGYYPSADPDAAAIESATQDLRVLVDSTLAGSVVDTGIASIVDDSTLYGGIDPGVTTQWASKETAVAAVMSISIMNALYLAVTDAPRMAMPTDVLCNTNQLLNYTNLVGFANATALRTNARAEANLPYDVGMNFLGGSISFNGIPFTGVRSLATTEVYMLDSTDGIDLYEQRQTSTEILRLAPDQETLVVSRAWIPVFTNRRKQGKMTGVTA